MLKFKRSLTVAVAVAAMVATFIGTKPTYAGDSHIIGPKVMMTSISNSRTVW